MVATGEVGFVFLAALLTAFATGLGALPFLFMPRMTPRFVGLSDAIAAGLMLGASHALVSEGMERDSSMTIAGLVFGAVFVAVCFSLLERHKGMHVGDIDGAGAGKAALIVAVMTLHSMAEGVGVGVSFGGGEALATFITVAIAVHNIPEGLAISLVLVPKGVKVWKAAGWSIFSSLPQPLLAVPAFLFVAAFTPFLPFGLAFAAGAMLWVVFDELVPDALARAPRPQVATALVLSFAAMTAFQAFLK